MAPGDLDTSFAGTGKKTISFDGADSAEAVLVQPNGRLVVAGGGALPSAFCVAPLQEDGKIVLVGDSDFRVAVARLKPDGTLDPTFSGDGRKTFSWGPIGRAEDVLVLPNGKLLVAGFSGPETGNVQLARLNANGALDSTFGTAGIATADFGGDDFGLAMARQANGRILIAGLSRPTEIGATKAGATTGGAIVARFRANGLLDPDFDGDGRLRFGTGSVRAVLVQPDRRIVVAGNANGSQTMTVTRLRPNGSPDTTFDGDGTATIDFGSLADAGNDAVLQTDGKIVVAGYTQAANSPAAVARLNADGSPDGTFGTAGKVTINFGAAMFGNAVALQANGRILVAGQRAGNEVFAIARLLG